MRTQHALALSTGKAGKRVGTYLRVGAVYSILLVFLFETPKALGASIPSLYDLKPIPEPSANVNTSAELSSYQAAMDSPFITAVLGDGTGKGISILMRIPVSPTSDPILTLGVVNFCKRFGGDDSFVVAGSFKNGSKSRYDMFTFTYSPNGTFQKGGIRRGGRYYDFRPLRENVAGVYDEDLGKHICVGYKPNPADAKKPSTIQRFPRPSDLELSGNYSLALMPTKILSADAPEQHPPDAKRRNLKHKRSHHHHGHFHRFRGLKSVSSAANTSMPSSRELLSIGSSTSAKAFVLYVDFNGGTYTDPKWNGGRSFTVSAVQLSSQDKANVLRELFEDFAPFDILVTDEIARFNTASIKNRHRTVVIGSQELQTRLCSSGGCCGVAYIGDRQSLSFAFLVGACSSVSRLASTISHEVGHTMGLTHDLPPGTPQGKDYFFGVGNPGKQYNPIMGGAGDWKLTTWADGNYPQNNVNKEDDVAKIISVVGRNPGNTNCGQQPFEAQWTVGAFEYSQPFLIPCSTSSYFITGQAMGTFPLVFYVSATNPKTNLAFQTAVRVNGRWVTNTLYSNPYEGSGRQSLTLPKVNVNRGDTVGIYVGSYDFSGSNGYPRAAAYGSLGYFNLGWKLAACPVPYSILASGATFPDRCRSGLELSGEICYPRCAAGFYGVGPVCWQSCPSGYTDRGVFCDRPAQRIDSIRNCPWYDVCGIGAARGCSRCPDSSWRWDGCGCWRDYQSITKQTYGRGVGEVKICPPDRTKWLELCYSSCKDQCVFRNGMCVAP